MFYVVHCIIYCHVFASLFWNACPFCRSFQRPPQATKKQADRVEVGHHPKKVTAWITWLMMFSRIIHNIIWFLCVSLNTYQMKLFTESMVQFLSSLAELLYYSLSTFASFQIWVNIKKSHWNPTSQMSRCSWPPGGSAKRGAQYAENGEGDGNGGVGHFRGH